MAGQFVKGQPKTPGSGRKPGQKRVREFYELLDQPGFSFREKIRAAVLEGDPKLITAYASLWRALAMTPPSTSEHVKAVDALAGTSDADLMAFVGQQVSA